jgi:DNA-binding LytR/AlgR family response regulator
MAPYTFLDRDLYLWLIMLFVVLFVDEARRAEAGASERTSEREGSCVELASAFPRMQLGFAGAQQFVLPEEVVRLAAADDYTEVFLATGIQLLHPEPLHKLLARLPDTFLRVHRSHAINLSHLRSFRKGARSSVRLSDESTAPVSRRRVQQLVDGLARAAGGEGASKTREG